MNLLSIFLIFTGAYMMILPAMLDVSNTRSAIFLKGIPTVLGAGILFVGLSAW